MTEAMIRTNQHIYHGAHAAVVPPGAAAAVVPPGAAAAVPPGGGAAVVPPGAVAAGCSWVVWAPSSRISLCNSGVPINVFGRNSTAPLPHYISRAELELELTTQQLYYIRTARHIIYAKLFSDIAQVGYRISE